MAIARRTKEFVESVTRLVGRHVPFGEPTQNVRGRHGCHEQEGRKEEAMEDIEPSVYFMHAGGTYPVGTSIDNKNATRSPAYERPNVDSAMSPMTPCKQPR